nr:hypothetical protein [Tanacetum cinerariifolium]
MSVLLGISSCVVTGVAQVKKRERMEEINHFFHEKHPLKLIDWETISGTMKGDDDENSKGVVVGCDMCEEPINW